MHNINITVRNKVAVNPAQDRYVCGNSDYVVHFDFDAEWDAHEVKTARFIKEDGTYVDQVFMGSDCPVPVISDTYKLQVGVFAGNLSTTTAAYVPCKKSILCGNGSPAVPEDDAYHHMMTEMSRIASDAAASAEIAQQNALDVLVVNVENAATVSHTAEEVENAADAGKVVLMRIPTGETLTYSRTTPYSDGTGVVLVPYFTGAVVQGIDYVSICDAMMLPNGRVKYGNRQIRTSNPKKLTLTGAVSAEYDGSAQVNVEVLPVPANAIATSYLRWNGTKWVAATIADLKADLGLT